LPTNRPEPPEEVRAAIRQQHGVQQIPVHLEQVRTALRILAPAPSGLRRVQSQIPGTVLRLFRITYGGSQTHVGKGVTMDSAVAHAEPEAAKPHSRFTSGPV